MPQSSDPRQTSLETGNPPASRNQTGNGNEMKPQKSLRKKLSQRTARVGIMGLGYVGLSTMVACAKAGYQVTGLEIDRKRVDSINAGHSYIEDIEDIVLGPLVQQKIVTATEDFSTLGDMDVIIVCVPTPVNRSKEPVLDTLREAVGTLAKHMRGEQLVVLQSTTFPGTTEELVLPQLERPDHHVGTDFYLAFSPERVDPGNKEYAVKNIPKVVGGVTPHCAEMASSFFSCVVDKAVSVSSPKVAEMTKLLENIFRSVNIALVNELSELCHRMNIDVWEVIDAASTKPFGFMPFYPGIGVGGHCIPVDPFYLSWKAREYDFYVNFIEVAARTNDNMPYHAVSRIMEVMGDKGKLLQGAHLLLLGVSFKKDIGDTRNSPAIRVAELLEQAGAKVSYSDRYAPQVTIGTRVAKSVELNRIILEQHDATVILVNHSYFDLETVTSHSELVIDTQDATRVLGPRKNVVKF